MTARRARAPRRCTPSAPRGDHPWRDRVVARCSPSRSRGQRWRSSSTWSRTLTRFENRPMAPWPALAAVDATFAPALRARVRRPLRRPRRAGAAASRGLLGLFGVSSLPNVMAARRLVLLARRGRPFARPPLPRHAALPAGRGRRHRGRARRRDDWLAARGIAYVVMVVPDKVTIYPEHSGVDRAVAGPTPYDRVARRRSRATGACTFVDLRPALRAAKAHERVYYKTDSHWNYNGAVVGYEALMRRRAARLLGERLPAIAPAHAARPTCRASTSTAATCCRCSACRGASARTTSRRSARCSATRAAAAPGASTRTSSGLRVLRVRQAGPAARRGAARLDGDPADPAAVGEFQPRGVREQRARSTAR